MTLTELRKLAEAATPVLTQRYASYDSEKLRAFREACEPERILAMLDVIEAAEWFDGAWVSGKEAIEARDRLIAARKRLEEV